MKTFTILFSLMLTLLIVIPQSAHAQEEGQCTGWNTCVAMGCAPGNTTFVSSIALCDDWQENDGYHRCCGILYNRKVVVPALCIRRCSTCSVAVYNAPQHASCPFPGRSCYVVPPGANTWGPD